MRLPLRLFNTGLGLALACAQASAQGVEPVGFGQRCAPPVQVVPSPYCPQQAQPLTPTPAPAPGTTAPTTPTPSPAETPPTTDVSFDAPRSGAGLGESFSLAQGGSPQMIGDFGGFCARRLVLVPSFVTVTTTSSSLNLSHLPSVTTQPTLAPVIVCDPVSARAGSGFKVADNESPRPQDRVYFTYNYFDNLGGSGGATPAFSFTLPSGSVVGVPATNAPARRVDVHRELFGFEKTFLDGNASVGLRAPFFQTAGGDAFGGDDFGDLTVVIKYALLNDRDTGSVLSAGLAVTAPTGPGIETVEGTIHSTLLQPYAAFLWNAGGFFVQGFTSLVVPTDSRDVTVLFNDLGVGYNLYRGSGDGLITAVAPTLEVHVTTPLNHRDNTSLISVPDLVDLTGGVHLGLGRRSVLSFGAAVPLTGPRPYDVEAIAQVNFRF